MSTAGEGLAERALSAAQALELKAARSAVSADNPNYDCGVTIAEAVAAVGVLREAAAEIRRLRAAGAKVQRLYREGYGGLILSDAIDALSGASAQGKE